MKIHSVGWSLANQDDPRPFKLTPSKAQSSGGQMAADANLLRGECFENPSQIEIPEEEYYLGFITALLEEQNHLTLYPSGPKEVKSG